MEKSSNFRTVLYRQTGTSHLQKGRACEDNVNKSYSEETGVTAVALSDGAGSYQNAGIGSATVVRVSADLLAQKFNLLYDLDDESAASYILKEITASLQKIADECRQDLESYSATLLGVAVHPDGRYLIFHVGDGAIIGYTDQDLCVTLSIYSHEGPANQATFVTVPNTEYHILRGKGGFFSFTLMSDGPEDFLVNEVAINPRVRMMQQLSFVLSEAGMTEQLDSLVDMLNENGMYDDVSFAIINDKRMTSEVIKRMNPTLRDTLIGSDNGSRQTKRRHEITDLLSAHPNGITVNEMTKMLHTHSPRITKKKINFLMVRGVVEYKNGRYYLSH